MFDDNGNEIEFYGNNLWSYYDNIVSNNYLSFDYYGFDKEEKISAPKFKLSINGRTSSKDSKIILDSCSIYKFSYQLKSEILKNIKIDLEKFKTDQKWMHGFSYNGYKKNIYVTIMWNDLSNSAVIRFMIGEKERTVLESDKIYVPVVEFFSLVEILNQAFSNYVNLCSISSLESNIVRLQKTTDSLNISNNIQDTSDIPLVSSNLINKTLDEISISISGNQTVTTKVDTLTDNDIKLAQINAGKESVETQETFDKFLIENRDSFVLDLPDDDLADTNVSKEEKNDCRVENELKYTDSKFISKMCNNDFTILEQIIFNTANEDLPFHSFVDNIKQTTDIDFREGISNDDYIALNYLISNNIKYNINQLLEKKVKLPNSITPIIVKNEKVDNDKIDTMYYLLLFYIYLSKIKTNLCEKSNNALDNKEYFSYIIKTISNPLVFSYFPEISEEVLKQETNKRYYLLKDNGFFDNFTKEVSSKIKNIKSLTISTEDIDESISKIYSSVMKFKDKLGIESSFNKKIMKVSYNELRNSNINSTETLAKIIHFDSSFVKYGKINDKIDLKSYDDVPLNILKIYGIKSAKFDNTIIIKYFNDNIKKFDDLEKIKRINKNVYDIIDSIDITRYDTLSLRALYFWNVDLLPKDLTYLKFKNLVDSSSLEKSELISMILNKTTVIDKDFYNSFLVSANDGTDV